MKSTKNLKPRKLALARTTVRVLGNVEITEVRGGITNFDCSLTPNVCPRELTSEAC